MQENISPEEKLLSLIKKGGNDTKNTPPPQPPKQEEPPKGPIAIPRKKRVKGIKSSAILNKFLVICALCAIGYMIFSYLSAYKPKTRIPERVELKKEDQTLEGASAKVPPLSNYTDVLSSRQMFRLYEVPKPKPTGPTKPKVTLGQLLGGYTFVGIIFGDVPQAIVEEKRTGQSFYLVAGQLLGEIKIEKIERGKITVSYEDERMDISI